MRQKRLSAKRFTYVHFTLRRFAGAHYGRFWFHRHKYMERTFERAPVLIGSRPFRFQQQ